MKTQLVPKRIAFFLVLVLLGAGLIEGTGLAQQRTRKVSVASSRPSMIDAFLDNPVNSTDELVAVLQKDKKLRQRYAKHFNIPEERIVDFVKNTLIVDRLKQDRMVTNYCITKTGRVYSLQQVFKKGTKVWALRDGTPILRWACANPLAKRLPMTLTSRRPRLSPNPIVAGQKPHTTERVPTPEIPQIVAANPVIPVAEPIIEAEEPLLAAPLSGTAAAVSGGFSIPGGFSTVPLTAISLPLISNIFKPGSNNVPVPEPASLLLLGSVLCAGIVYRRRSSGKRTH